MDIINGDNGIIIHDQYWRYIIEELIDVDMKQQYWGYCPATSGRIKSQW
jgi:hypothetical protein